MFCIECGHKLTAAGKFCPQCGAQQTPSDANETAASAIQSSAAAPPEQAASRNAAVEAPFVEPANSSANANAARSDANSTGAHNTNFASQPTGGSNTIIVVSHAKSLALAIILALFFGPLGLLYSTVKGAVIMFFVNIVVGVLTIGVGLFITWPIGVVWAAMATNAHNAALVAGAQRQ